MQNRRGITFGLFLKRALICMIALISISSCNEEGNSSEFESFIHFIRAVDPQNLLKIDQSTPNPCLYKLNGVKCNLQGTTILEIKLENLNLSGVFDADSLCKLSNLRAINLARNRVQGTISSAVLSCTKLTYLNLSSNLLSGKTPKTALAKLKHLKRFDISKNQFTGSNKYLNVFNMESSTLQRKIMEGEMYGAPIDQPSEPGHEKKHQGNWKVWLILGLGFGLFLLFAFFVGKTAAKLAQQKETLKSLQNSPYKTPLENAREEVKLDVVRKSELVFFVEENERFKLEDLLEAEADLRNHSMCSSLYKVLLSHNVTYAVKRLKNLNVSFEEFGQIMRKIGNMKHPNILPLVGYSFNNEEKLLIYKYQSNGSLLNLLEEHIEGKREFSWRLRLSIAGGIARGLNLIYQKSDDNKESLPHGNLKLSNILLDENDKPLISEYGISKFIDPEKPCLFTIKGYTAPERLLTEKGDVFSFGVILLELLTSKPVEKSRIDLPKWVNAIIREEWTGEVFDKNVAMNAKQWAFPLLNVALKCVSNCAKDRPTMAEVLVKIEEVIYAQEDQSSSSMSSKEYHNSEDCCVMHSIISDTWDTPASNY